MAALSPQVPTPDTAERSALPRKVLNHSQLRPTALNG
jgi:hypothetical protein